MPAKNVVMRDIEDTISYVFHQQRVIARDEEPDFAKTPESYMEAWQSWYNLLELIATTLRTNNYPKVHVSSQDAQKTHPKKLSATVELLFDRT